MSIKFTISNQGLLNFDERALDLYIEHSLCSLEFKVFLWERIIDSVYLLEFRVFSFGGNSKLSKCGFSNFFFSNLLVAFKS